MDRKVEIKIVVDPDGAVKGVRQADGSIKSLGPTVDAAGAKVHNLGRTFDVALGTLAAGAVYKLAQGLGQLVRGGFRLLSQAVEEAGIQQIANRKLEQALKNLGGGAEAALPRLQALASEIQRVSNFGDDEVITAQAMLATFKDVSGPEGLMLLTPRLADMAAGMAKATGETVDLNTVAQAVGKSLSTGSGALSRYGVSLSDMQREAFDAAKGMERVQILAQVLDDNFKGLAAATVDPFKQLHNAAGDLLEEIGMGLRPELEALARDITDLANDPDVIEIAQQIGDTLGDAVRSVWQFLKDNAGVLEAAGGEVASLWHELKVLASTLGDLTGYQSNGGTFLEWIFGKDLAFITSYTDQLDRINSALDTYLNVTDRIWAAITFRQATTMVGQGLKPVIGPQGFAGPPAVNPYLSGGTGAPSAGGGAAGTTGGGTRAPSGPTPDRPGVPVSGAPNEVDDLQATLYGTQDMQTMDVKAIRELTQGTIEYADAMKVAMDAANELEYAEATKREAIIATMTAQIAATDTSIQTGQDALKATLMQVRQIIQAKIAEGMARTLGSVPFPLNVALAAAAGAAMNLIMNKILPGSGRASGGGASRGSGYRTTAGVSQSDLAAMNGSVYTGLNFSGNGRSGSDTALIVSELQAVRTAFEQKHFEIRGQDIYTVNKQVASFKQRAGIR